MGSEQMGSRMGQRFQTKMYDQYQLLAFMLELPPVFELSNGGL